MNCYDPESGEEHTLAGRLIPLAEALYYAIMKAGNRPLSESKYSTQLPVWCHSICDQFTKTVFRKLVAAAPEKDRFNARAYGQIVGILLRGVGFWLKDVPSQIKCDGLDVLSPAREAKFEKLAGMDEVFSVASDQLKKPITNEDELLTASGNYLETEAAQLVASCLTVLRYLATQPAAEQYEFLCGLPEGFNMVIDEVGQFANRRGRYEIYIILLSFWPEIAAMQAEQPPKTRRDLLEWLEEQEGRQLFEDPKAFYELCGDIDLNLAPPGHPPKSQPQ